MKITQIQYDMVYEKLCRKVQSMTASHLAVETAYHLLKIKQKFIAEGEKQAVENCENRLHETILYNRHRDIYNELIVIVEDEAEHEVAKVKGICVRREFDKEFQV